MAMNFAWSNKTQLKLRGGSLGQERKDTEAGGSAISHGRDDLISAVAATAESGLSLPYRWSSSGRDDTGRSGLSPM